MKHNRASARIVAGATRRTVSWCSRLAPWLVFLGAGAVPLFGDDWPRWRGVNGSGVSQETNLPARWSKTENVVWAVKLPGEGASSPIVWGERLFLTVAFDFGARRSLRCLDRHTGHTLWSCEVEDDWPEITSALTGHAAPTPVTDGQRVIAFFGNAGAIACDLEGRLLWRRELGDFESDLGIASSPILHGDTVILVCDHDGDHFNSFDSFLIALDAQTGQTRWKTNRPRLHRSWSTPIVVPVTPRSSIPFPGEDERAAAAGGRAPNLPEVELVVAAQDLLRGYDPRTGSELWRVAGLTGWVAPSPVYGVGRLFAASGKDGPTLAVRPGGRGDVTESHVVWSERQGAPYVSSPLLYDDRLYVANELGIVTCRQAASGELLWRQRLAGKFWASPVAADGKIYLPAESGKVFVIAAGPSYRLLAENDLEEEILASPAIAYGSLFVRTQHHLYRIAEGVDRQP